MPDPKELPDDPRKPDAEPGDQESPASDGDVQEEKEKE